MSNDGRSFDIQDGGDVYTKPEFSHRRAGLGEVDLISREVLVAFDRLGALGFDQREGDISVERRLIDVVNSGCDGSSLTDAVNTDVIGVAVAAVVVLDS